MIGCPETRAPQVRQVWPIGTVVKVNVDVTLAVTAISQRLRRIEKLTGLSFASPSDVLQFR
jgi:hypothetical protein